MSFSTLGVLGCLFFFIFSRDTCWYLFQNHQVLQPFGILHMFFNLVFIILIEIFFVLQGNCKYGDTCKYYHPTQNVKNANQVAAGKFFNRKPFVLFDNIQLFSFTHIKLAYSCHLIISHHWACSKLTIFLIYSDNRHFSSFLTISSLIVRCTYLR